MNLRLILWTVGMAYATFILARGNGASSFGVRFTAPFLGAAIGYGLGGLFAKSMSPYSQGLNRESVPKNTLP